mmetsp:Transcript_5127/g.10038  ORF Transcript_5127/g.10038 Transcript_5127/m.10038 type:complete len:159 (-) Transcript_5127:138-614(-)
MEALLLAAITVFLALLTSWLLHRSAGSKVPATMVDDEFFQRIHERSNQDAPGGVCEGGLKWTQTSDEVEVEIPLEAHMKARDVEFRILPTSVSLRIKGATTSLLEGKLHRRVKSDECNWSIDGEGEARSLKLTLVKQTPTKGSLHWTGVLEKAPPRAP